ncbi:MAG: 2-phospho-L-lactate transferase [Caldilineales bacterium]
MTLPVSIVALAGGVGGAKLATGLYHLLSERLSVVVNTGDDFQHWGLSISPDLDTVLYNLADIHNPATGWGLADETHQALVMMQRYGAAGWFSLGDRDLATHLLRTEKLAAGATLTAVMAELRAALGIGAALLPMSDQPVRTLVHSDEGVLPFQRYFVQRRCEPRLLSLEFSGIEAARPTPQVLAALDRAAAVILCPSNPYLSLDPILLLPGLAERLRAFRGPVLAVSPIVGGQALKGPAAKIMAELGVEVSPVAVARHIQTRIRLDGFVLDTLDAAHAEAIAALGITPLVTDTVMGDLASKERLALAALTFCADLRPPAPL